MQVINQSVRLSNMRKGIDSQIPFIRNYPQKIYDQVRGKMHLSKLPSRVYLVGCGDSWYCGLATRLAFEAWAGVPTEALQALEFSRYYCAYAPKDALVVAVSNSGRVSRTVEAVLQAKSRGIKTVGCTREAESRLAQVSDVVLDLGYPERVQGPGTSSYMASMLVQYCIALYLGELSGTVTPDQVIKKLAEISSLADGMQRTVDENIRLLSELGESATKTTKLIFIGGGPNYGTAFFSMAKVLEAAHLNATGQELEEWAHEQYFVSDSETYFFVLAAPGASIDRSREQFWAAKQVGAKTIAICDHADVETARHADAAVKIFGGGEEVLSPLLYCIPGELFAYSFAATKDLPALGIDNPNIRQVNFQQIFSSHMIS